MASECNFGRPPRPTSPGPCPPSPCPPELRLPPRIPRIDSRVVVDPIEPAKDRKGETQWCVYKFGGTSVATADCFRNVRRLVLEAQREHPKLAVVISAMGGRPKVTDLLIHAITLAAKGNLGGSRDTLDQVRAKHFQCAQDLFAPALAESYQSMLDEDIKDLTDILRAVSLMRYSGEQIVELVSGYGEVWSARMLTQLFKEGGDDFVFVDARKVLFLDEHGDSGPEVLWVRSQEALSSFMAESAGSCLVITGFIASTSEGVATTLKRDGSDYSASIFGKLLNATGITIWTDVDGVLSADPRRVPEVRVLADVSYNEAMELAYFGAKVIHPKTMTPAVAAAIPIYIRNTFNPLFPGTRIFVSSASTIDRDKCVCGFSTVDNMALLNLEGSGMIGVPGIAHRLFGAIQTTSVSVSLIAQASSEYSISFCVRDCDADVAAKAVSEEFHREFRSGLINKVDCIRPCSIIAAVGDGMSNTVGAAGKFFKALGSANVNILAISQGSSERIISAVVKGTDSTRSLRAVHSAFLLSNQVISVGVVGRGKVARAMIDVIKEQAHMLYGRYGTELQLRAIMDSKDMVLSEMPLDLTRVDEAFQKCRQPSDLTRFTAHVKTDFLPHSIIIDCSDSEDVAEMHANWLEQNLHVVTANKKGLCGSMTLYNAILRQRKMKQHNYMYEVTVGGGLKIITSLQAMLIGGDRISKLEGTLSASMNYVFGLISPLLPCTTTPVPAVDNPNAGNGHRHQSLTLSQAIAQASRLQILERNPMDDLRGVEMAQKLLVLAREMGLPLRLEDVKRDTLLPQDVTLADLPKCDSLVADRVAQAAAKGSVLRYVASLSDKGEACVSLQEIPYHHPFASVRGAGYCFRIYSAFHSPEPITIQGTIGLPKSTAATLFSDVIFVAQRLGAKDKGHSLNGQGNYSDSIL